MKGKISKNLQTVYKIKLIKIKDLCTIFLARNNFKIIAKHKRRKVLFSFSL